MHGLNTLGKRDHALHTWTAKNGKVWLRDFLPVTLQTHIQDAPDTSARIFNYQYNSNVVFETSQAGVTGAAETLLNLLHLNREVSSHCIKLIFPKGLIAVGDIQSRRCSVCGIILEAGRRANTSRMSEKERLYS